MLARYKKHIFSRLLAGVLVLCTVMPCLPIPTYSADQKNTAAPEAPMETEASAATENTQPDVFFEKVRILVDGGENTSAEIMWDSRVTLTAQYEGGHENVDSYTWQIREPATGEWIPVYASDGPELTAGAALLSGMTDEDGIANLNCKILDGNALYYSNVVSIKLRTEAETAVKEMNVQPTRKNIGGKPTDGTAVMNTDGDVSGGELITHTVRVEYYNYITGEEAAKPYIATVKPNTEESLTVFPDSPTVVGFTPYIITRDGIKGAQPLQAGEAGAVLVYEYTEDGNRQQLYGVETHKLRLDLSSVTEDITYQIVYLPNRVYYTVSHYVQNIVNDDYVLYYVETKQGYVGQMTQATNLTLQHPTDAQGTAPLDKGFTALVPFKNQTIAADGTTQINTYYDRMYYLMTFKLDGGRGTEPVYARYGTTVHTADPVRTGYTFVGWVKLEMEDAMRAISSPKPAEENGEYIPLYTDRQGNVQLDADGNLIRLTKENGKYYGPNGDEYRPLSSDVLPKTVPTYHSACLAVWEKADTEYTVVYWLENADHTNDTPTEGDFDYWCAITRTAKTGLNLSDIYKELEDPYRSGATDEVTEEGENGPETKYYYYYYSDFRPLDTNTVNEITVSDNGKTMVNVYYRRREYNLRFFYARSYQKNGAKQYQVIGGSSYGFSTNDKTTTQGLLEAIGNNVWGDVDQPVYTNRHYYEDEEFTTDITLSGTKYTYYAIILKARYGQNIADEWPSENFAPVERTSPDPGDFTTKATFSGWNGEFWLKYSRDQYRQQVNTGIDANYTIKGNYQVVDENLLYDATFNDPGNYKPEELDSNDMPYGRYYTRGTGARYLDFVAFWENGNSTGWSVPRQFHYYIWTEAPDQSDAAKEKAIAEAQQRVADGQQVALYIKNYKHYSDYLPHSDSEFQLAEGGVTTAIIEGTLYVLYDKVNACDDSRNPAKQTVPGIAGYIYAGTPAENTSGNGYWTYEQAMAADRYYYQNTGYDKTLYESSYTLNFAYKAGGYNITLQSWNHIRTLGEKEGIVYNSMVGANLIVNGNGLSPDDPDYDPGYMYESMMENYYPADLPEGAYYFAGWYKTADYIPGTEANFDKPMPNYNIMLYAKWVEKRFNVEVFQTSDRDELVYYPLSDTENGKMQALVELETVNIHGQQIQVGKENTGKGYGEHLPEIVSPSGPDKTYTVTDGQLLATIPENGSPLDYTNGTGRIRKDWIFVCYAYMKDGVEHAIDVSNFTITEDVQIYAKWTAVNILDYKVEYVLADISVVLDENNSEILMAKRHRQNADGTPCYENGKPVYELTEDGEPVYEKVTFRADGKLVFADGVEWIPAAMEVMQDSIKTNHVADPVTGKVNEGANRTFQAKTGAELYPDFQKGYFPLTVSHTALMEYGQRCSCCETPVLIGSDEEHPLITTFYYVPLSSVPYRVQYLDKFGNAVIDLDKDGDYRDDMNGEWIENTGIDMEMVVTRSYRYREGYVPDAFQKTLVLSANIEANVITFLYEKTDGQLPYTVYYYYETLGAVADEVYNENRYLLHHTVSGTLEENSRLEVDYLDITGYEYAADLVVGFTTQDLDSNKATNTLTTNRGFRRNMATGQGTLELTDLRGHKMTVTASNGGVVYENDGHTHDLTNSIFTYTYGGIAYRVTDIRNVNGSLVVDGYANPGGVFQIEQGSFGTVVKVYYDLKMYPYYIIHRLDNAESTELQVIPNIAKFQKTVSGTALTDAQLIQAGYAGYSAKDSDKTITVTMTIQDDSSTPHINTITFLYYEKMMEFDYVPMLLKSGVAGEAGAVITPMPKNEPNAQINLVRDYIKTVTGTTDAAQPIIYEEAYTFCGWFLDPECTRPVANSAAAVYLGTDYTQDETGASTLTDPLSEAQNMTADQYRLYDTLLPQKKIKNYQYVDENGQQAEIAELEYGVYVGAFNSETGVYDQQETFYALFAPVLGNLTVTRRGTGADVNNEANSFVYTISRVSGDGQDFTMQVAIGPEDFQADGSASVVITNLPLGRYTVTQENDWSWRYEDTGPAKSIVVDSGNLFHTVVFQEEIAKDSWLSGFSQSVKNMYASR